MAQVGLKMIAFRVVGYVETIFGHDYKIIVYVKRNPILQFAAPAPKLCFKFMFD